jgi:hypothetical protein
VKNLACLISLRSLSQSLIIILMLISPLSFSTDKITNFTYECPVSTTCSIKTNRRITQQHQDIKPLPASSLALNRRPTLPVPLHSTSTLFSFPSHCRAPPA